jgi:hypothetical protein
VKPSATSHHPGEGGGEKKKDEISIISMQMLNQLTQSK